jgi:hypothetical protein
MHHRPHATGTSFFFFLCCKYQLGLYGQRTFFSPLGSKVAATAASSSLFFLFFSFFAMTAAGLMV